MVASGAAGLEPLTGHRWVEPLRDAIPRLLVADLAVLRGPGLVWRAPVPPGVNPARRLRVEIVTLIADAERRSLRLQARWWLNDTRPNAAPPALGAADLSVDLPRQRHYLPTDRLLAHGVNVAAIGPTVASDPAAQALIAELCEQARTLMMAGAPLALQLPGRIGWELRLVVQGGLLILDRADALQHRTWHTRPRLRSWDLPRLLWRAARMKHMELSPR